MSAWKFQQSRGWLVALPYFDALSLPLTAKGLRRYSWMAEPDPDALAASAKPWRKQLGEEGLYGLRELNPLLIEENRERMEEYWRWVGSKVSVLSLIPFVELVMVMNGMAHGVARESSDIDLFVVARPGRVWMVRAMMLGLLTLLGLRARPGRSAKRFSPEFFVDSNHMDMEIIGSQSTYLTSFWVADFTPIVYPQNFERFWNANRWLKKFLPVAYKSPRHVVQVVSTQPSWVKLLEKVLAGGLGDTIERSCYRSQKRIIEANLEQVGMQPGTIIDESVIKILWPLNIRRAEAVEREVAEFLAGAR